MQEQSQPVRGNPRLVIVLDQLVFDTVVIAKIEAPPGFVIGVVHRREALRFDQGFGGVQIIDGHPDMVQRAGGVIAAGAGVFSGV